MLTLMKPTYFIPIHGEDRTLQLHREMADSVGVEREIIFILNNGDVGKVVLHDRKLLSEEGMLIIVVSMSKSDGRIISNPDTISRGFVYERDANELYKEVNELVITTIKDAKPSTRYRRNDLKHEIRKAVDKLLYTRTRRRPMILPFIIEI